MKCEFEVKWIVKGQEERSKEGERELKESNLTYYPKYWIEESIIHDL